ncbi:MAG: hypothetical protein HW421_2817 [Ignavibacteria bacterium]|nr:hypothetical protein [Ignavibacteria bacterium]
MKINTVIIKEPIETEDFYPFSVLHAVWELRCGALMLYEKIIKRLQPTNIIFYSTRKTHLDSFLQRYESNNPEKRTGNVLSIDGNILFTSELFNQMNSAFAEFSKSKESAEPCKFVNNGNAFAAYYPESKNQSIDLGNEYSSDNVHSIELKSVIRINYVWDILDFVGCEIDSDRQLLNNNFKKFDEAQFKGVSSLEASKIFIGENVKIMPCVALIAEGGEIVIDSGATIYPNSTIIGPCYIGKDTKIKTGAKIYENTAIGPNCKVGGEIENSIFQGYSNKQHEGFLGHSFLGEWVNLGADTNNSDLKNTYSSIKIRFPNKAVNTGRMFLGLICGDHTKSAINTQFTTGTIAGVSANLYDTGFLPASISSFCWGGNAQDKLFQFERAIEVARIAMARRKKELSIFEEELLQVEYNKVKSAISK